MPTICFKIIGRGMERRKSYLKEDWARVDNKAGW